MNQESRKAGNRDGANDSLGWRIRAALNLIFGRHLRYPTSARPPALGDADLKFALAVPDTDVQYRAFLQIIDAAEEEALTGARTQVVNDRLCVNSLGMADGAALVRTKLLEAREEGLSARKAT